MYIPTSTGPLRDLSTMLREPHERRRAAVLKEIEERKAKGIPLDDATDFGAIEGRLLAASAAAVAQDGAALREALTDSLRHVSGGLKDPGEFTPKPEHEGIGVRLRPLTEGRRLALNKRFAEAKDLASLHAVYRAFVAEAVEEVAGIEDDDGPVRVEAEGGLLSEAMLDLLDRGDLFEPLFLAVKAYHEVEPAKKKRFGCLQPSTSPPSTAPVAALASASSAGATAAPASTDSPSRTTAALEGTGSSTLRSANGTGSTEPPKGDSAPPASL